MHRSEHKGAKRKCLVVRALTVNSPFYPPGEVEKKDHWRIPQSLDRTLTTGMDVAARLGVSIPIGDIATWSHYPGPPPSWCYKNSASSVYKMGALKCAIQRTHGHSIALENLRNDIPNIKIVQSPHDRGTLETRQQVPHCTQRHEGGIPCCFAILVYLVSDTGCGYTRGMPLS